MSKHTPGPWFIGRNPFDYNRHIYATKKVRDEYGEEYHPLIATTSDDEPIELVHWVANARLIAAAPELLNLAELVVDLDTPEDMAALYDMATKLIKKVRGEE